MAEKSLREEVFRYVREKYGSEIEHLWARWPDYAVFRHADNQKWYGIVMDVEYRRLGMDTAKVGDILNVKVGDAMLRDVLIRQEGYFRGWHFSRGNWVSILLDGTVPLEEICSWIDTSFMATASKETKKKTRPPKEWLVPANPKYFDIAHAFDSVDVIDWKQGAGIRTGDTVYLYAAAPISAILYRCAVEETGIPYHYEDGDLTVREVMRIRLQRRYDPGRFTFGTLKEEYGIYAVRGPRGIPDRLHEALERGEESHG